MTPLISICIPVYNVAPYIERCIRSLMEQTYNHLEYIFVDDCSTDSSLELVRAITNQYPERCAHTHIIRNSENRGVSYTRRICIETAKGDYIVWVDSDDYVELDMIEKLYTLLIQNHADVISGGNYVNYRNKQWIEQPFPEFDNFDSVSFPLQGVFCSLWGAIYKRELFHLDSMVPDGMDYLEDRLYRLKIALSNAKIVHVNDLTYHYIIRESSITSTVSEKTLKCFILFWQTVDRLLADYNLTDKYKNLVDYAKVQNKTSLMLHTNSMKIRKEYAPLFHEEEKKVMHNLSKGYWLMSHLIHYKLWGLIRLYQSYINIKTRLKCF